MAWLPYNENVPAIDEASASYSENIVALLNVLVDQIGLLNARIEEAFETHINIEDVE